MHLTTSTVNKNVRANLMLSTPLFKGLDAPTNVRLLLAHGSNLQETQTAIESILEAWLMAC